MLDYTRERKPATIKELESGAVYKTSKDTNYWFENTKAKGFIIDEIELFEMISAGHFSRKKIYEITFEDSQQHRNYYKFIESRRNNLDDNPRHYIIVEEVSNLEVLAVLGKIND